MANAEKKDYSEKKDISPEDTGGRRNDLKREMMDQKNNENFEEIFRVLCESRDPVEAKKFRSHLEQIMSFDMGKLIDEVNSIPDRLLDKSSRDNIITDMKRLEMVQINTNIIYSTLELDAQVDKKSIEKNKQQWIDIIKSIFSYAEGVQRIGMQIKWLKWKESLAFLVGLMTSQTYMEQFLQKYDQKLNLGLQKYDPSEQIRFAEKAEKIVNEHWEKTFKPRLLAKNMTETQIKIYEKSFKNFLKVTDIGQSICKSLVQGLMSPLSLLVMGFYLHNSPDRQKAAIEYMTFVLAWEAIQWGISFVMKQKRIEAAIEFGLKQINKMPRIAALFEKLWGKWVIGTIIVVGLILAILTNPDIAKKLDEMAENISDRYLDTDNIAVDTLGNLFNMLDVPFGIAEDLLRRVGLSSVDPQKDQLSHLKNYVGAYHDGILRAGMITRNRDIIGDWNDHVREKKGNTLQKELWETYTIDDIKLWGKNQIPEFFSRASSIKNAEHDLAEILKKTINPRDGKPVLWKYDHLTYFDLATTEQNSTDLVDQFIPDKSKSNAYCLKLHEDLEEDYVMHRVKDFCLNGSTPEWAKTWEKIKEKWKSLSQASYELAREVDVYNALGVYDKETFCNPFSENNSNWIDAYISASLLQEKRREVIQISDKRNENASTQAHEIVMMLTNKTGWIGEIFEKLQNGFVFVWNGYKMVWKLGRGISTEKEEGEMKTARKKIAEIDQNSEDSQKAHEVRQHLSFVMQSLTHVRSQEWINNIIENHLTSDIISGEPITLETFKNLIGIITEKHLRDGENIQYKCTEDQSRHEIYIKEQWDDHDTELKNSITIDTHNTSDTSKWEVRMIWDYHGDAFGISEFGTMKNGREWFEAMRKKISWVEFVGQYGDKIDKSWAKKIIEENMIRLKKNDEDAWEREKREEEERRKQRELFERAKTDPEAFHELHKNDRKVEMDGIIIYFADKDIYRGSSVDIPNRKRKSEKKWDYLWYYPEDDDEPMKCSYITSENAIATIELKNIKHLSGLSAKEQKITRSILCTPQKDGLEKMIRLSERHKIIHSWNIEDYGLKLFEKLEPIYEKTGDKKKFLENLLQKLEEKWGITVHNWEEFITEK